MMSLTDPSRRRTQAAPAAANAGAAFTPLFAPLPPLPSPPAMLPPMPRLTMPPPASSSAAAPPPPSIAPADSSSPATHLSDDEASSSSLPSKSARLGQSQAGQEGKLICLSMRNTPEESVHSFRCGTAFTIAVAFCAYQLSSRVIQAREQSQHPTAARPGAPTRCTCQCSSGIPKPFKGPQWCLVLYVRLCPASWGAEHPAHPHWIGEHWLPPCGP